MTITIGNQPDAVALASILLRADVKHIIRAIGDDLTGADGVAVFGEPLMLMLPALGELVSVDGNGPVFGVERWKFMVLRR